MDRFRPSKIKADLKNLQCIQCPIETSKNRISFVGFKDRERAQCKVINIQLRIKILSSFSFYMSIHSKNVG